MENIFKYIIITVCIFGGAVFIYLWDNKYPAIYETYDYKFKECVKKKTEATKEGAINFCYRHLPDPLYGIDKESWINSCYREEYLNFRKKHRDLDKLSCELDLIDFK